MITGISELVHAWDGQVAIRVVLNVLQASLDTSIKLPEFADSFLIHTPPSSHFPDRYEKAHANRSSRSAWAF
jgi:hypothetical protein